MAILQAVSIKETKHAGSRSGGCYEILEDNKPNKHMIPSVAHGAKELPATFGFNLGTV